ncbi:MAG: tetratricopeptide repeat protein [Chlamydiales bacterium]|jgi:type III secretion system low calcium response chaperone LcrH/SycD|nr:tetratricopeptide repeat protein [Chlamydiales bacterium]
MSPVITHLLQSCEKNLQELKKLTADEKEELYRTGSVLYSSGEYRKASYLFSYLVLSDPLISCSWYGLASCKQLLEEYPSAIEAWNIVCKLQPQNPLGYFHAAECYLSIQKKKEALQKLDKAEILCDKESLLHNRIQILKTTHGN